MLADITSEFVENMSLPSRMTVVGSVSWWMVKAIWIGFLAQTVGGQLTFISELWQNQNVCVANVDALENLTMNSHPNNVCMAMLHQSKNKTHTIEGKFYRDHSHQTNLTLEVPCAYTNLSRCDVEEQNTTCPGLKLCCRYIAKHDIDSNRIMALCPSVLANDSGKPPCQGTTPVTYHHSLHSRKEVRNAIINLPDRFYWTDSYIAKLNVEGIKATQNESSVFAESESKCIRRCLNTIMSPKVSFIQYSPEKNCTCYARDESWLPVPDDSTIYEVKDSQNISLLGTEVCIAAALHKSEVVYHVRNCSYSYILLCGPILCSKRDTGYVCDYSGDTPQHVTRGKTTTTTQTTSSTGKKGSTNNQETTASTTNQGFPAELIGIIVGIVIGLMFFVFVTYRSVVWMKRKFRKGPMERGRPNSLSNRTYLMQNAEENEDLYSTIRENVEISHDMPRPLLPPRNFHHESHDLIVFKSDYSTPSDTILNPPLVTDLDVYTDTYDNPLRKSAHTSQDDGLQNHVGQGQGQTIDGTTQAPCRELCKTDGTVALDMDIGTQMDGSILSGGLQCESGGDIEAADDPCETPRGSAKVPSEDHSNPPLNNYYRLTEREDKLCENSDPGQGTVKDDISLLHRHVDHTKTNEAEDSDYEDTSVLDGKIEGRLTTKVPDVRNGSWTGEKNLLCTLSPVLLKQLNIKIVPDENEYATSYTNWPRSSSHEKLLDSDDHGLHDGTQCKCGNTSYVNNKLETENQYDKLCHVRRVVSAGKPRNMYYHVVLKDGETKDKSTTRRASV